MAKPDFSKVKTIWFCWHAPICRISPESGVGGVGSTINLYRTLPHSVGNMSKLLESPREVCQVNHLQAIVGPNAPHDSVDVVLYSLLGEIQVGCDFLVCQSLSNQGNNLLLTPSQPELKLNSRAGNSS